MEKWCGDGFLGYGYDKVSMSCVGGEGRTSSTDSEVCTDEGMCKIWTSNKKLKKKKRMGMHNNYGNFQALQESVSTRR